MRTKQKLKKNANRDSSDADGKIGKLENLASASRTPK